MPLQQSFAWWSFFQDGMEPAALLRAAADIGYDGVDLIGPELWPLTRDFGLTVAAVAGHASLTDGLNDPRQHTRIRRELLDALERAAAHGIPNLIVFSGNRGGRSEQGGLAATVDALRAVAPHAEAAGVTLVLELLNSRVDHPDYQADHTAWGVDMHIPLYQEIAVRDADLYERLDKAGFLLDFGDDGSGLFLKYLRCGSGYYIDVGASELIADGKVGLRSGVNVERVNAHSVTLTDGTELPADLIVYATGYGSMNGWAARLISQDVADKGGKVWGLGSGTTKDPGPWEGELRNMWKPTQVPNLWFHGGNLHQSRHYSLYLALQLKARMEGVPTPVYGLQAVHHLK